MFAPHVLEAFGGVKHHVVETLGTRPETRKIGQHQLATQSPAMTVAAAFPESPHARYGVFLCLIAIGVSPPDGKPGNMWL
ncbi:hypothetical protein StoSoilB3_12830 [Arthrobacter sp. StoSoilB3]|nr:hypothetical protein StoSoilB3_12830 [Arthrobacter sp. StoSoilB3]GGV31830.1 hypothetical protein GCM10010212_18950 [Paenarthrobacter nicotinovorans]